MWAHKRAFLNGIYCKFTSNAIWISFTTLKRLQIECHRVSMHDVAKIQNHYFITTPKHTNKINKQKTTFTLTENLHFQTILLSVFIVLYTRNVCKSQLFCHLNEIIICALNVREFMNLWLNVFCCVCAVLECELKCNFNPFLWFLICQSPVHFK